MCVLHGHVDACVHCGRGCRLPVDFRGQSTSHCGLVSLRYRVVHCGCSFATPFQSSFRSPNLRLVWNLINSVLSLPHAIVSDYIIVCVLYIWRGILLTGKNYMLCYGIVELLEMLYIVAGLKCISPLWLLLPVRSKMFENYLHVTWRMFWFYHSGISTMWSGITTSITKQDNTFRNAKCVSKCSSRFHLPSH